MHRWWHPFVIAARRLASVRIGPEGESTLWISICEISVTRMPHVIPSRRIKQSRSGWRGVAFVTRSRCRSCPGLSMDTRAIVPLNKQLIGYVQREIWAVSFYGVARLVSLRSRKTLRSKRPWVSALDAPRASHFRGSKRPATSAAAFVQGCCCRPSCFHS